MSNLEETHREGQEEATNARRAFKKKSKVLLLVTILILVVLEFLRGTDQSTKPIAVEKRDRVVRVDLVLPANGPVSTELLFRCYTDNLTDEQAKNIVRVEEGSKLKWTSQHEISIGFSVWFFDEGGNCRQDGPKLRALGLFK